MVDTWRVAKSLLQLRKQVDHLYPRRSKGYDGTIGDARHAAEKSDHNPNAAGVVTAMDITHDPANGCNAGRIAETLRRSKDERIKYVIWNAQMFSSYSHGDGNSFVSAWTWRPYTGRNIHDHHVHVSVAGARIDGESEWVI